MKRSIHITYDEKDHQNRYAIRDGVIGLVDFLREKEGLEKETMKILDCGCGVGQFMRDLRERGYRDVEGIDMDERVIEIAGKYGKCQVARFDEIPTLFGQKRFDVVIMSHVLEHVENPSATLRDIFKVCDHMVVAVPNPLRPKIQMKFSVRNRPYANKGHYHSWDRSHFINFLTHLNGYTIEKWGYDRVRLIPFRIIRKLFRLFRLLDLLEVRFFPKILPAYSDSLMVLISSKQ